MAFQARTHIASSAAISQHADVAAEEVRIAYGGEGEIVPIVAARDRPGVGQALVRRHNDPTLARPRGRIGFGKRGLERERCRAAIEEGPRDHRIFRLVRECRIGDFWKFGSGQMLRPGRGVAVQRNKNRRGRDCPGKELYIVAR